MWADTLAGDTFDLGGEDGPKRISRNWPGSWQAAGVGTVPQISLNTDDLDGTEASTGTASRIWRRNYAACVYAEASAPSLIRLRIPAQDTATGDFRLGAAVIGPAAVFGWQYDRGYKWRRMHNTTVETAVDGTRRSRNNGPSRRAIEFAWTETQIDQTELYASDPTPDYVTGKSGGGGVPIAARRDTPRMVEGLLDRIKGADTPVAFLGKLTPQTGDGTGTDHITDTTTWIYGRIVSDTQIDVVLGDEGDDEVHKLNKITIEEEI
jgi:hypothetical protein